MLLLKVLHCLLSIGSCLLSKIVSVLSSEISGILFCTMAWDDSSKALVSSLHWSINERQLSDVVLVNHAKNWLFLLSVYLWVLHSLGVGGQKFPESIIWNQTECLLLWLAVDSVQWLWETT